MLQNKKSLMPIDLIAGLIIFAAGILVCISYVNLGLLLVAIGTVIEAIKIVLSQGAK